MKKYLLLIFLFTIIFSCKNNESNDTLFSNLPDDETKAELNQWALTKYPSLKLREEPLEESKIINHLPDGAIVEIIKKENNLKNFENIYDYWYFIDYEGEIGWIFGYYLDIFNSYEEAYQAAEKKSEKSILENKQDNSNNE